MKEQRGEEVKIFLVGNKADLDGSKTEKRVVKLRDPRSHSSVVLEPMTGIDLPFPYLSVWSPNF